VDERARGGSDRDRNDLPCGSSLYVEVPLGAGYGPFYAPFSGPQKRLASGSSSGLDASLIPGRIHG